MHVQVSYMPTYSLPENTNQCLFIITLNEQHSQLPLILPPSNSAAFARHRGKTGTLHLLQEDIFRLEKSIESVRVTSVILSRAQ